MSLTLDRWHSRYLEQAHWTAQIRKSFLENQRGTDLFGCLEVGCGTGAVLRDFRNSTAGFIVGLDINHPVLSFAAKINDPTCFIQADGYLLPFRSAAFNLTFCHFLLLWLKDPLEVLHEMKRVTCPGGWVAAFAEPDHLGRIDFPETCIPLGQCQTESLVAQGVDPSMGRKLRFLFKKIGLINIHVGLLSSEWHDAENANTLESNVLKEDLSKILPSNEIENLLQKDREARKNNTRIAFVPTFFAWGQVPSSDTFHHQY